MTIILSSFDTIEEFEWTDEEIYFNDFIAHKIKAYEKQYRTNVVALAIVGRLGLWNGSPVGGKMIGKYASPFDPFRSVDALEVDVDEDNVITILGHHHDGTHEMHIYPLTESRWKKISGGYSDPFDATADDFEKIYEDMRPLRFTKKDYDYYNVPHIRKQKEAN